MESPIIRYYGGHGTDHRGRFLGEVLAWDDEALENVHDFIQWLFPLSEPSGASGDAPVLTVADEDAFRNDALLRQRLLQSLIRMLAFYGLRLIEDTATLCIERSDDWSARAPVWLRPHSHNYLRLTRIMKSLKLLGLPEYANALCAALLRESRIARSEVIGETTLQYWKAAGA